MIEWFRHLARNCSPPQGRLSVSAACIVVVAFALMALFGESLAPHSPNTIDVQNRFAPPSAQHLLGTDHLGRDVASRVMAGARVAGLVALTSISIALLVGIPLGFIAAFGPRWLDAILMLFVDSVRALPGIMLALALATLIGPGLGTVIFVAALLMVPGYARFARGQVMALRTATFVEAQRALAAPTPTILFRHILPNTAGQTLVLASMDVPAVIAFEAGLSFLGLGVRPPNASWGVIVADSLSFIREAPELVVIATLPLAIVTVGFTTVGEHLRDRFDPRSLVGIRA